MKKRSIILFFGSFNPVHNGHTAIAESVPDVTDCDELWFVVSPRNPFKGMDELAPEADRLRMVELAIEYAVHQEEKNAGKMKACDVELSLPKPSWTANTLKELSSIYADFKFKLLIGSDNADYFDQWKDYQYIIDNYEVLVYPREGYEPVNYDVVRRLYLLPEMPLLPHAATDVREIAAGGGECFEVCPPVWEYIKEHRLYGCGA